jgi:hypothetical protein
MAGLLDDIIKQGIQSYGARYAESASDPLTMKGKGYFGAMPSAEGGFATEISATDEQGRNYPLLTPNLTQEQINMLLQGVAPTNDIYNQAESFANYRRSAGMDPFATPTELRIPPDFFSRMIGNR